MACTNCNTPTPCGCTPLAYTVVPPCPPACAEVFNAQCIVYTGVDLVCGADTVILRNDYLDSVITKLVDYICASTSTTKVTVSITMTTATNYTVTHNLGSTSVMVQLIDDATNTLLENDPGTAVTVNTYTSNTVQVRRDDGGGLTRIVIIG